MPYLWLKAAHVAFALVFIGGLFLQCFAVASAARNDVGTMTLASGWDRRVTVPAMLMVWLTGGVIATQGGWFGNGNNWLWAKLALVIALTGLHGIQSGRMRRLGRGDQLRSRMPPLSAPVFVAVSIAFIALLVVVKPF